MKYLAQLVLIVLGGCTFSYGLVNLPPGTTNDQRQIAMLVCKEEARLANSGGNFAAEYLLGASIIGLPAGIQMEIDVKREAFTKCMNKRGYIVIPPAS